MTTELTEPVSYQLAVGDELIALNSLLGKELALRHTGRIFCVHCGKKTTKSFNQGYCYPCFTTLAQCDLCIVKPETCHYAEGSCREPAWGESYLFSSNRISAVVVSHDNYVGPGLLAHMAFRHNVPVLLANTLSFSMPTAP